MVVASSDLVHLPTQSYKYQHRYFVKHFLCCTLQRLVNLHLFRSILLLSFVIGVVYEESSKPICLVHL
uniref:Uncharacterized protein n=1 Tax=Rhizophora mucronata TaxID=61149 RepID=A0A2P2QKX1_RHIMU